MGSREIVHGLLGVITVMRGRMMTSIMRKTWEALETAMIMMLKRLTSVDLKTDNNSSQLEKEWLTRDLTTRCLSVKELYLGQVYNLRQLQQVVYNKSAQLEPHVT